MREPRARKPTPWRMRGDAIRVEGWAKWVDLTAVKKVAVYALDRGDGRTEEIFAHFQLPGSPYAPIIYFGAVTPDQPVLCPDRRQHVRKLLDAMSGRVRLMNPVDLTQLLLSLSELADADSPWLMNQWVSRHPMPPPDPHFGRN